jgi:hypothetical protein
VTSDACAARVHDASTWLRSVSASGKASTQRTCALICRMAARAMGRRASSNWPRLVFLPEPPFVRRLRFFFEGCSTASC